MYLPLNLEFDVKLAPLCLRNNVNMLVLHPIRFGHVKHYDPFKRNILYFNSTLVEKKSYWRKPGRTRRSPSRMSATVLMQGDCLFYLITFTLLAK